MCFPTAKGGSTMFEIWDIEDGMGGSSLKILVCFGMFWTSSGKNWKLTPRSNTSRGS